MPADSVIAAKIFTIGHSTRTPEEVVDILTRAGVRAVADVRAYPSSRRHPQFNRRELLGWLPEAGIAYEHLPELGGRRTPIESSGNGAWRERGFRAYADHMRSREFAVGRTRLEQMAAKTPTAIMCAEAAWWRCHRRLIADALVAGGWRVEHLGVSAQPVPHELPGFAVVQADGTVSYPPAQESLRP